MQHEPLVAALAAGLAAEPGAEALFLAGSHGAGRADRWSDLDFLAVAEPAAQAAIGARWRATLEAEARVVFWNQLPSRGLLLNAITEDWLRLDLHVLPRDGLGPRAKSGLKPIFDRAGIFAALPDDLPAAQPDPRRVSYQIREFLRVLGLMPVGLGRGELVTMVKGTGLLRDLLSDLMLEDCPLPDRGGILHLSRLLPPAEMALLRDLPWPGPERAALIAANLALAEAFLPRARDLARRLDLDWPEAFEAATRRHIERELGIVFGGAA